MNSPFVPLHLAMFLAEGLSILQGISRIPRSVFWGGMHVYVIHKFPHSAWEREGHWSILLFSLCKVCPDVGSSLVTFMLLLLPINEKKKTPPTLSLALLHPLIPWRLMGEDEQTQMRVQQGRQDSFPEFRSEPAYWCYLLLGATARVEFSRWRGKVFNWGDTDGAQTSERESF